MVSDNVPRPDDGYLVLADISGFTAWMAAVGDAHAVDVSQGIPPGFTLLQVMLDSVTNGLAPRFSIVGLEGDAVFGVAPSREFDGQGDALVAHLRRLYGRFVADRDARYRFLRADHTCSACPLVSTLDLKMVLHQGPFVRQVAGGQATIVGPAVNVVHRLLKNTVAETVGYRHYLFMTDAAAHRLGLDDSGIVHRERYRDVGEISGRVFELHRET